MQVICNASSLPDLDPEIRTLIQQRIEELGSDAGLATFIVLAKDEGPEALEEQLGFSVLADRVNGRRFGEPGFCPAFESVESHPGCFELVFVLADYGDGVLVFIPKHDGLDPRLSSLCETYATSA